MAKIKMFDKSLVRREVFVNQRCYEAALFSIDCVNKLHGYMNAGYVILDQDEESSGIIKPVFEIDTTVDFSLVLVHSAGCRYSIVGCCHGGPDNALVYITKRDVKEWFKRFKFVRKEHILNLY